MGLLDWILRRKPAAPAVDQSETEEPFDPDQTTFIKGRLSPKAQAEIKQLRQFKDGGGQV